MISNIDCDFTNSKTKIGLRKNIFLKKLFVS